MLFVSLAGPATNFILMVIAALERRAAFDPSTVPFSFGIADLPLGVQILFSFALVNLFLGLFNLLPIPPLDGSAIIERALPGHGSRTGTSSAPTVSSCCSSSCSRPASIGEFLRPFEDRLIDFVFLSG